MAAFSVTRRNPISRLDSMSILDFVFSRGTLTEVTISLMRIAAVTALIVLSAAYAVLIAVNVSHAAGGPDESGYMNEARLLGSGHARVEIEPLRVLKIDRSFAWTFTPYGFAPSGRSMLPTYPPGYPVHMLIAASIVGWNIGPFVISPLAALLSIALMYALARELDLSKSYAIAAAAIFAAFPTLIMQAIQVMSDTLATMWALAAIVFALRSLRKPSLAFAAGIAFGIGVAVRPTNILLAIPLASAMRFRWTSIARAIAGAIPIAIALMIFNAIVYGNPLTTGYGNVSYLLGFGPCLREQSLWMMRLLPIVFPAGLLVIFDRKIDRWHRALLITWFAIFLGYYALWPICDAWWYTRFLLPATPPLIIGALMLCRDLTSLIPQRRIAQAVAIIVIVVMIFIPARQVRNLNIFDMKNGQQVYPGSVSTAERLMPRNAIVISGVLSGAFFNYSHRFTARYDQLDADRFALLRAY